MKRPKITISSLKNFVSSKQFFVCVVLLLIVQSLWIAISSNYPMAFDEDFHVGLIKLYSEHLLPFWSAHPAGGDAFGALTRDPSYLYHYIFGLIYVPLNYVISNFTAQIIIFRTINIALLALGLVLFRKLLLISKASPLVVNLTLLIFVLVPVVPLLGAQINYDNLIIPLTAYSLILSLKFVESLKKNSLSVFLLLKLIAVCLFASLVKYAFLPIFLAIVIFVSVYTFKQYASLSSFKDALHKGWQAVGLSAKALLIILILILGVLAYERYGLNVSQYHKPVPDCGQVLSYDNCKAYGPWIRDYDFARNKVPNTDTSPLAYSTRWLYGMWLRSFFAVSGKVSDFNVDGKVLNYQSKGPLYLPAISSVVFLVVGFILLAVKYRNIFHRYFTPAIALYSLSIVITVAILWTTQYQFFVKTTQPVAINGRYLFPVLPMLLLLILLAYDLFIKSTRLKTALVCVLIVCFIWGGGAMTYILRSNNSWYWSNSPFTPVYEFIQRNIGPFVPGNSNSIIFLRKA